MKYRKGVGYDRELEASVEIKHTYLFILSRCSSVERIHIYRTQGQRIPIITPLIHKVIRIAELAQNVTFTRGVHLPPSAKRSPPSEIPVSGILSTLTA